MISAERVKELMLESLRGVQAMDPFYQGVKLHDELVLLGMDGPFDWPDEATGDFIRDMARMIHVRGRELTEYMIEYHPVCRKHADRLREEVASLFEGKG